MSREDTDSFKSDSIQKLVAPKSTMSVLGMILGSISIFKLLEYSLEFGVARTFQVLFSYYDKFLCAALSWCDPYVAIFVNWIAKIFDFNFILQSHWRHIFVLLLIYFMRDALTDFQRKFYGGALFLVFWGSLVAVVASAISGAITMDNHNVVLAFAVAFTPVIAAFIYTLLRRVWHATFLLHDDGETPPKSLEGKAGAQAWMVSFNSTLKRAGTRTLVASAIIAFCLLFPRFRSLTDPGIAAFALLVFCLAAYWMVLGLRRARDHSTPQIHWKSLYWDQSASKMGASMMSVFFWVGVFLILNAGAQFAGL